MKPETMNNKVKEYFSSINSTSRRMMTDIHSISESQEKHNESVWSTMSYTQQQELLYRELVTTKVKDKYSYYPSPDNGPPSFPKLLINSGEKMVVDPENEDSSNHKRMGRSLQGVSWRDEHSAPFCWETRSQLEGSLNDYNPDNTKNARNSQIHYENLVLENWKFQFPSEHDSNIVPSEVLRELGLNYQNENKKPSWNLPGEESEKIEWSLTEEENQPNTEWNLPEENEQKIEWNQLGEENQQKTEWNMPQNEDQQLAKLNLPQPEEDHSARENEIKLEENKSMKPEIHDQASISLPVCGIQATLNQSQFDDDDDDLSIPKTGFDFLDNW